MSPNASQLFQISNAFFLFKVGVDSLLFLFFLFLLVLLKQIYAMNTVIAQKRLFGFLRFTALLLLGTTVGLFILTLVLV